MTAPPPTVKRILLCLDGSPLGEAGIDYALGISKATGAAIHLLTVVDASPSHHPRPVDALGIEIARVAAARYLDSAAAKISTQTGNRATPITTEIADGRPAEQVLQVADRDHVDLIVLATRSGTSDPRLQLAHTAERVAQHARQSVLLVPTGDSEPARIRHGSFERVLVLLDGSIAAESSLPSALELSRAMGTEIILGHAAARPNLPTCEPPTRGDSDLLSKLAERSHDLARGYLRDTERSLRAKGAHCRAVIRECESIRQGILAMAEEEDVDLVLLTSHGHTSSDLVTHGGVTQQILVHAKRPVWVVQNLHIASSKMRTQMSSEELRVNLSGPPH